MRRWKFGLLAIPFAAALSCVSNGVEPEPQQIPIAGSLAGEINGEAWAFVKGVAARRSRQDSLKVLLVDDDEKTTFRCQDDGSYLVHSQNYNSAATRDDGVAFEFDPHYKDIVFRSGGPRLIIHYTDFGGQRHDSSADRGRLVVSEMTEEWLHAWITARGEHGWIEGTFSIPVCQPVDGFIDDHRGAANESARP